MSEGDLVTWERPPKPPYGWLALGVTNSTQRSVPDGTTQVTHLLPVTRGGVSSARRTACGLTRFDTYIDGERILADLPSWSIGGGHRGPGVAQVACEACWAVAETTPLTVVAAEVSRDVAKLGAGLPGPLGDFCRKVLVETERKTGQVVR